MENLRIFHNGKIATNSKPYFAEAIAVEDGLRYSLSLDLILGL